MIPAWLRPWLSRGEPKVDRISNLKAGIGAIAGMLLVGQLALLTELPLLIAPLGSTAVLLFGQPSSPMTQPVNIICGYLIGAVASIVAFSVFPGEWVATAVAVGAAVVVMRQLRVTHPPAGALPILGFGGEVQGSVLLAVVLIGCAVLIGLATVVHRIPPRRKYPSG